MSRVNHLTEMPFYRISDFELIWENESTKQKIMSKMTNNGFIDFLDNHYMSLNMNENINIYKYFDTDEYTSILKKHKRLNIMHMNCRMLSHNKGKIISFLNSLEVDVDILLLSEIGREGHRYLKSVFPDYEYEIDLPQNNSYGGVAIVAKNNLDIKLRNDLQLIKECECTRCHFESVFVELNCSKDVYIIGCIYRHPNGKIEHFTNQFSKILEKNHNDANCIIGGDLNIDLLNITNKDVSNYVTELLSHNFLPKIILPTRITDSTCTLIDHMFLKLSRKNRDQDAIAGNIFAEITDHLPVFLSLNFERKQESKRPFIRIINERTITLYKNRCSDIDWEMMNNMTNVDDKFNFLQDNLVSAFDETFPLVQKSRKRNKDKKWITQGLKISIRKKIDFIRKKCYNHLLIILTDSMNIIKYYKQV